MNHRANTISEAIGISEETLFQELSEFQAKLFLFTKDGLEIGFKHAMEYLDEKPRILVAALMLMTRRQVAELCSLLDDDGQNPTLHMLGMLSQGVGGVVEPYALRPSEEIEIWSMLPPSYLSVQTILWGLCFLTAVGMVAEVSAKAKPPIVH